MNDREKARSRVRTGPVRLVARGIALCCLLAWPGISAAATVNWSGTVQIHSDFTLAAGDTLTIAPGTEIVVDPMQSTCPAVDNESDYDAQCLDIIIYGTLNAVGTSSAPIIFRSNGQPADWAGVALRTGAAGTISYAIFRDAKIGLAIEEIGDSTTNRKVEVSFSTFENNQYHAIAVKGDGTTSVTSNPFIHNNIMRYHPAILNGSVIKVDPECQPLIQNNLMYDNQEAGVAIKSASPRIINNTIVGGEYGVFMFGSDTTTKPEIRNNILTEFTVFGVGCELSNSFLSPPQPVIAYNNIVSSVGTAKVVGFGNESWTPCSINCNAANHDADSCTAFTGAGNLSNAGTEGIFASTAPGSSDYRLKVTPVYFSPSVDAGDPDTAYNDDASVIAPGTTPKNDQGAYGGPLARMNIGHAVPLGHEMVALLLLLVPGALLWGQRSG